MEDPKLGPLGPLNGHKHKHKHFTSISLLEFLLKRGSMRYHYPNCCLCVFFRGPSFCGEGVASQGFGRIFEASWLTPRNLKCIQTAGPRPSYTIMGSLTPP